MIVNLLAFEEATSLAPDVYLRDLCAVMTEEVLAQIDAIPEDAKDDQVRAAVLGAGFVGTCQAVDGPPKSERRLMACFASVL